MFDLIVILVIGLSTAFAAMRGGLRELATLIALAAAGFLTFLLAEPIVGALGKSGSFFATLIVVAVVAGLFFVAFHILAHLGLKRLPLEGHASLADRIGGGVFGFARGLVLVGLGFLAYGYYLDDARQPDSVKNAMTRPIAAGMANWFQSFTPEEDELDKEKVQPVALDENAAAPGYDRSDRNGLEEMVTTVTTTDGEAGASDDPIADIIAGDEPQ